jgi:four helix bundle protein
MKKPKSESRNPNGAQVLLMPAEHGKPYNLRERTLAFGIRILQITRSLPQTMEATSVRRQLIRSGTSIGANVEDADGAFSKADTRRSFIISKKEAQETAYWLRIVDKLWGSSVPVTKDLDEAEQLIRILRTIIDRLGT